MKKLIFGIGIMVIMVAMAQSAQAMNIISYNFGGGPGTNSASKAFTTSGVTTTATATWDGFSNAGLVNHGTSGLGVWNTGGSDSNNIDGDGRNDYLHMTFGSMTTLRGLYLSHDDSNDFYDLYVDGTKVINNASAHGDWDDFATGLYQGFTFTIRADGSSDDYTLYGMRIENPVPEPTTVLLMSIGIAGLIGGAARRKLKQKAVVKS